MGIEETGQVCVMIHSGSRGLGHQVATDSLVEMEKAMGRDDILPNDRQLACARITSTEGQQYLKAMAAAANYAWVNRSAMTFLCRQAFAKQFDSTPDDLDMAVSSRSSTIVPEDASDVLRYRPSEPSSLHPCNPRYPGCNPMYHQVIYDVSHNIAKVEEHMVNGRPRSLLVHRKGSTRAFPPHHPLIPVDYQFTGQPVLVGGTMGTCSYVLTGTERGMEETFGSTCHGAGRAKSRAGSRRQMDYTEVLEALQSKGIAIRVASPKLVMEEAPQSYKDVNEVVDTCHATGISSKCVKLRPIAVIKG